MASSQAPKARMIGLTGGIGSGKSTVAGFLAQHGQGKLAVVDADQISRDLTAPQGAAIEAIAKAFGKEFIAADGALDREHMRQQVFAQPAEKAKLETIMHPLIFQAIHTAAEQAIERGAEAVVLDIPLLVESVRWRPQLHDIVVVDCPTELQIERVQQRSKLPREQVERIIQSQAPRALRLACADVVVYNAGLSLAQLEQTSQAVACRLGLSARS